MQSCFCASIIVFEKHTESHSEARDAPTSDTRGIVVTTIQLKLSRSRRGCKVADKDEDKDAEKDADENKDFIKDNSV